MVQNHLARFIAWRYLQSPRQEGFVAVVAWFSFVGILLGVATLIIVMSVMNGFRHELMNRILGLNGHLTVYSTQGTLTTQDPIKQTLSTIPGVISVSPLVEKQGLFMTQTGASGGMIHGMLPADLRNRALIANHLVQGSLTGLDHPNTIVIGHKLARKLNLQVGDRMKIMSADLQPTAFGFLPRSRSFQVIGIFDSGLHEYDQAFAFIPLTTAQAFFDMGNTLTGLEVFVAHPEDVSTIKPRIQSQLNSQVYGVYDWQQANTHFFNAIEVERNVMFLILTLIVLVAVFNIISCLVMLVKDKTRDIAILRTVGAPKGLILRIFFFTGATIGIMGTLCGTGLGLAFAYNIERIRTLLEKLTGVDLFRAEIYFLSHLPARVDLREVVTVMIMALMLSFLATLYPAWKASRLNPVEGLRYE